MTIEELARELTRIARANGWDVGIVADESDVVGVIMAGADDIGDLAPYGYAFSVLTTNPTDD
jgi:hypothetical protein